MNYPRIVSFSHLQKILKKSPKKIIVLVTGCFDLLHFAHKEFLEAANSQGEILLVGLETDKRVNLLKGKGRPVNNWKTRALNLSKLEAVNYVFPLPENLIDEKNSLEFLKLIKPNILAVSENTPYLEVKKKLIKRINGSLYVFPYNINYSTTKALQGKS